MIKKQIIVTITLLFNEFKIVLVFKIDQTPGKTRDLVVVCN
jgi:hypothetical protein